MSIAIPISEHTTAQNNHHKGLTPLERISEALKAHPHIAISFSGAEDVLLIELAVQSKVPFSVFTLDTGRLHPQTYAFIETVRNHYLLNIKCLHPDAQALGDFTTSKGMFSFYNDGHQQCCAIRKVAPLSQQLAGLDAWITGQRQDQSPTRSDVPLVQLDSNFKGRGDTLLKYNPLADLSSSEVWSYIRMLEVPFNPLHQMGFVSIGCEPCTRAVLPNQHEREGRWWWEEATQKECGLHK